MFKTLLIANRGEIARRIARTARRFEIRVVAVYSDADQNAPHVREADEAYRLGPPPPAESYLLGDRILEIARRAGAEAVHPGYGFLSENAAFAEACAAAGVAFVGPKPASIRAMGDKAASKQRMREAGVPLAPGYDDDDQDPAHLAAQAAEIGWPVMIKASAGGGGKGMRVVRAADAFAAALESCQREATGAFGDARVLIEKFIERPRHVEVQVFADSHGRAVHLFDRDCSAQRRHQKVIEEAPAPDMPPETARAMREAAIRAAQAVDYVGAGTVEFLLGADGAFYFMEMNTRLQVEHPVTEQVCGVDLVEWQLRVAAGEPLPLAQDAITLAGHAMEARLYAEDPAKDFLPATGPLTRLAFPDLDPARGPGRRVDAGVVEGDWVSPHYDPMIAKLIAHGPDRETARARLVALLQETRLAGLATNRDFLVRLLETPDFADARLDTGLIERNAARLGAEAGPAPEAAALAAALFEILPPAPRAPQSPFDADDAWRLAEPALLRVTLKDPLDADDRMLDIRLRPLGDDAFEAYLSSPTAPEALNLPPMGAPSRRLHARRDGDRIALTLDDRRTAAHITPERKPGGRDSLVDWDGRRWRFTVLDPLAQSGGEEEADTGLRAPMPGKVSRVFVEDGAAVARGDPLLVIEAMKMEHSILAPSAGRVRLLARAGDQVEEGEALADIVQEAGHEAGQEAGREAAASGDAVSGEAGS